MRLLMIAIGGALGALARYGVSTAIQDRLPAGFPWGTFIVNLTGCFVMGVVATLLTERTMANPNLRYLIPIGFIGAYTTFSAFEYDTFRALTEGAWVAGLLNVLASVIVGYAALWAGVSLARGL